MFFGGENTTNDTTFNIFCGRKKKLKKHWNHLNGAMELVSIPALKNK